MRFERPNQNPVMAVSTGVPSPAPRVTNSGAKCSVRGWASRAAGARCSKSSKASISPSASASAPQASNSTDQAGGAVRVPNLSERTEVVREEAAADEEDPSVAQRREGLSDGVEFLWIETREGQLQHRDIGLRVHGEQRDPCPVIEASTFVASHGVARSPEVPLDQCSQVWRPRCRIGEAVVALRKPPEVVHEWGAHDRRQRDWSSFPVGRDHENALRTIDAARQLAQLGNPARVIEERWGSMSQIQRWHGHALSVAANWLHVHVSVWLV